MPQASFYFWRAQGEEVAKKYNIPAYATLPMDPAVAALVDAGNIPAYDAKDALKPIIDALEALPEHVEGDAAVDFHC